MSTIYSSRFVWVIIPKIPFTVCTLSLENQQQNVLICFQEEGSELASFSYLAH